jgi:uncharacterized membrane protein YGL010W
MAAIEASDPVAAVLRSAFAPLHKRALGLAVGITAALVVFAVTAFHILTRPADGLTIELLVHYFYGYDTTWPGAAAGAWWSFFSGFVIGWFIAFTRNFMLATWMLIMKTKAELFQTRDFLDHI